MSERDAAAGVPVTQQVDPTANVIALVKANAKAVTSLREADEKLASERFKHVEFVAKLRAAHTKEMRDGDNERLAQIRLVDQGNAAADKKTVLDAVQVLAATTESNRLQLEKRVADTAETLSKAKTESEKATEIRISALERTSFTSAGEKAVADPALASLADSVAKLVAANQLGSGERRGGTATINWIVTGLGVLFGLGGFVALLMRAFGK